MAFRHLVCVLVLFVSPSAWAQARFIYTNNGTSPGNTVDAFVVGTDYGLSPVDGSPFAANGPPTRLETGIRDTAVVGNFLYVASEMSQDVSAFLIDVDSGVLTPVVGSPFSLNVPVGQYWYVFLAPTPNGQYLYAGTFHFRGAFGSIQAFRIEADGGLTDLGIITISPSLQGLRVSPDGRFLAVTTAVGAKAAIAMFQIDSTTGGLTMVDGSPFVVSGPAYGSVEINCASDTMFVVDRSVVDVLHINDDGTLQTVPGSPFPIPSSLPPEDNNSIRLFLSADGRFLFTPTITNSPPAFQNSIAVFNVAPDGGLSNVAGSPFLASLDSQYVSDLVTDATGAFLYAARTGPSAVSVFSIGDDGSLSQVPGPFYTADPNNGSTTSLAAYPARRCQ